MDINELETYRLSDAIKYHDRLNPQIWGSDEHLRPEVRAKLLEIAADFQEFLGIDVDVADITISGSNAAYTYTPHSDIDLHLVVDLPRADSDAVYRELFDAKKYQYNDRNDFRIGSADVELYVQDPSKPHHSQGIYSVKRGEWIDVPKRRKPDINDVSVRSKYEDLGARIESAIESGDLSEMDRVAAKIKEMRQAGLDQHGEFGAENLAFKILRNNGTLEQLSQARKKLRDQKMSLEERRKKKSRKRKRYAYGGYWYPGYHYYGDTGAATDGGGDSGGGESIREDQNEPMQDVIERFARSCSKLLALKNVPRIRLRRDPAWTERNGTFGRYTAEPHNTIELATSGRHIIDILRTLAHEMTHAHQNDTTGLPANAGETGSRFEDEANAMAGRIMRHWAESEPEMFSDVNLEEDWRKTAGAVAAAACVAGTPGCATTDAVKTVQTIGRVAKNLPTRAGAEEELRQAVKDTLRRQRGEVVPESSGYIPTEKQKNDPRYSMALTQDIRPGETGRQANKLGLKTDSQGRPDLLMKKLNNLLESVKAGSDSLLEDQDLFEVKMSPGELQKWAQSEEAQGIRAGFEAELIFRDTARDEQEESEPDYDQDERARSIDDIVDFFQGGENGMGRNAANRLRDRLYEEFGEWQMSRVDDTWDDQEEEQVRDWMESNVWEEDQDEYRARAAEELELDSAEPTAEDSEKIEQRARELFEEDVESTIANRDQEWQNAYENFSDMMRDSDELSEGEWLESEYSYMTDIASNFSLDWPYWTEGNYSEGRDVDEIADSLSRALGGARVRGSTGYHSVSRRPDLWIVEPDGSLDPDEYEDAGLEVVSPPMPLPDAMAALKKVLDWANGSGDAYTNDSTGLHMGVSLPFKGGDVDYVKLILFLGDQYVLDEFGRAANNYTRSALEKLQDVQRSRRRNVREQDSKSVSQMRGAEKTAAAMDLMKKNLIELAARYVQDGVGTSKYTSAHIKDGYIEFRSPGGDYLSMDNRDESALGNTMLRFARAMQIAGRPDVERQEYSKKLYKLLTGYRAAETKKPEKGTRYRTDVETEDSQDALELFAKYSTGQITPEELKKQWARQVLEKEMPPATEPGRPGQQEYEVVLRTSNGDEVIDVIRARDDSSANSQYREKYRDDPRWFATDIRAKMQKWEALDSQGGVVGTVQARTYSDAVNQARDQGWNYNEIRRKEVQDFATDTEPEKKVSRRAKVAQRILEKPIWWVVQADTGNYVKSVMVQARGTEEARKKANQEDPWFAQNERVMRDYGTIRAATAKEIEKHNAVVWQVTNTNTNKKLLVAATDKDGARNVARRQDPEFNELYLNDPDSFWVQPATEEQIQQYHQQQADNAQDIEQIQQRVQGTQQRYLVQWTEQRDGREVSDSLGVSAANATAAMDSVRQALAAQGRQPTMIQADQAPAQEYQTYRRDDSTAGLRPVQAATGSRREYQIYSRATDNPVIGFMAADDDEALERLRRYRLEHPDAGDVGVRTGGQSMRTQTTPQGEWTGHWIVRDENGQELTRFHGIGNDQQDANRHAIQWLTRNGYGSGTEVEVVPEMR
jgi:hypothetical protein